MIQRVFSFIILLALPLLATQYNSTILELEAKIFPKIILLNEGISKDSKELHIFIISKEIDYNTAYKLKKLINYNYPDTLMGKKVCVDIKEFQEFQTLPDALIVLYHCKKQLTKIALWANTHNIISFAYDPSYMEYGILGSLYIGKSTKPYLNKNIIQKYNFTFNPYLLELSKFK